MRTWRDWFIPAEDAPSLHDECDQVEIQSGARHKEYDALQKNKTPRCARCKRWMGYGDGMYIMISDDWRVHIRCFSEVLERHFKMGETIDLTTGQIIKVDTDDA